MEEKEKIEREQIDDDTIPAKEGEPMTDHYSFPLKGFLILTGIVVTLMIVCVIVILCNGGFYQW